MGGIDRDTIELFLLLIPIILASMVLHEIAHGVASWRLGDPTAKMMGRLSPNPIRHLDPLGTAMFAITWFGTAGTLMFGWAKPVQVQPRFFNHPQRGMALVALAGPMTNFALALPFAALFAYREQLGLSGPALKIVTFVFFINVLLGVFNLLPIPPLDGSRIIGAAMPREMYERWSSLDRFGFLILLVIFFVFRGPFFEIILTITQAIMRFMVAIVGG
jgi:Zn-dependent protease